MPFSTLPRKVKKKRSPEVAVAVALVVREGALLLAKRPAKGLLASMWAPPAVEGGDARALAKAHGVRVGEEVAAWRHVFTHRVWNARAYRCEVRGAIEESESRRLVRLEDLGAAGIPTAFRPAVAAAADATR